MNKNEIAKNINYKTNIGRIISTNHKLNLSEGEIYDNQGKAESWMDRETVERDFVVENEATYTYYFTCDNVPCHKVDYTNQKEVEILGAENCEHECEVLVPANAILEIISEPYDEDWKDMGYYTVELEFKGFK